MEIPLVLKQSGTDRLAYALPAWYRAVMGAIGAIIVGSLVVAGGSPGFVGWIVIVLVLLGGLYEERWTFDRAKAIVAHRAGLVFWARETTIPFGSIAACRLSPFIRGSIPGSDSEREDKEAALALGRGDDVQAKRSFHKKAYLTIVLETSDGAAYLVNMMQARRGAPLRDAWRQIADFCGAPPVEG